jgi:hypothetical protein
VLNAGIAGNRVLHDATAGDNPDVFGPAAVHRLDADVLAQAGVTTVILLEGIADAENRSLLPTVLNIAAKDLENAEAAHAVSL